MKIHSLVSVKRCTVYHLGVEISGSEFVGFYPGCVCYLDSSHPGEQGGGIGYYCPWSIIAWVVHARDVSGGALTTAVFSLLPL